MTLASDDGSVNREKTCPLLLRMFYSSLRHNNAMEYSRGRTPNNELQVYTWLDATLRELASLVKQVNPEARKRGTVFDFALVSPDYRSPVYRMRELGAVCAGSPSDTDRIMLKDCQFVIGDMVDVAITVPPTNMAPFYSVTVNSTETANRGVRRSPSPRASDRNRRPNSGARGQYLGSRYGGKDAEESRRIVTTTNTDSREIKPTDSHSDRRQPDRPRDRYRRDDHRSNSRRVVPY
ncbi:unnamed protein product [Calicophoron daubneyi]|uniref:18 kDa Sin3-associated polypeptide n=1 Tax=Calicophoron daubneyi TaxID=300641 RepID=A0AAV2SX46_CALDB